MDLIDLFPQTIAVTDLASLTAPVIEQAKALIDNERPEGLPGDGTYTGEQHLLNHELFKAVRKEFTDHCLEYARAFSHDVERIGICNFWGNVVRQGESIRHHSHDNSYISGVFFLSEGSQLNILKPAGSELFGCFNPGKVAGSGDNFRSWDSFNVPPKPGRMVHIEMPDQEG